MKTFKQNFCDYAELTLRAGVNLQPGQTLVIHGPVSCADFVRQIAELAYTMNVGQVYVDWQDDVLDRLRLEHAPLSILETYPTWKSTAYADLSREGAAFLMVEAPHPDHFAGIDSKRLAVNAQTKQKALDVFYDYTMANRVSWTVVSVPNHHWAAHVFPALPEKDALEQLWNSVFMATRADQPDPVDVWQAHSDALLAYVKRLNEIQFRRLLYTAPGTDLSVELPTNHVWAGGRSTTSNGLSFSPNIPTEEVFTAPHRLGVEGTLSGTRPVLIHGTMVDGISLVFKEGRIVQAQAATGQDALAELIDTDEGAHYLGEVALVPHTSPISQLGFLFYDTLYDENASSHCAIGGSYAFCIDGGPSMSEDELLTRGMNQSLTHVDFMVGSGEMDVDAETQAGQRVALIRQGDWVW